jgi:hypothetical protein
MGEGATMMFNEIRGRSIFSIAASFAALAIPTLCAGQAPRPAVDVLKADIDAVIAAPDGGADRQIKVVDVGKLNVCSKAPLPLALVPRHSGFPLQTSTPATLPLHRGRSPPGC